MSAKKRSGALWVAIGIFLSRVAGLVRDRALAHFLGNSDAADAFRSALRIPNVLQNLFGEGVLSASFIPVYVAKLESDPKEAQRIAGAILTWMIFAISILVVAGVAITPALIALIAPGFSGDKRDLTIHLVRILFPGTGLLVISAWCLGVLNSHRKFFMSYAAPIFWNAAIVAALIGWSSGSSLDELAVATAWGVVAGSALQILFQLPSTLSVLGRLHMGFARGSPAVREVFRNFGPVMMGRGVVQISAYVDNMLASLLPTGTVSSLTFAQTLFLLPVSLFGMSISASELPELSRLSPDDTSVREGFFQRLSHAYGHLSFFIVPSCFACVFFGDAIVACIYQTGRFSSNDTHRVWALLAPMAVSLMATTSSRLYSSSFYALRNTKTPFQFALVRVATGTAIGMFLAFIALPRWAPETWDPAMGLAMGSALGSLVENRLLKRSLSLAIGNLKEVTRRSFRTWVAGAVACMVATAGRLWMDPIQGFFTAISFLLVFGVVYLICAVLLKVPGTDRLRSFFRRR